MSNKNEKACENYKEDVIFFDVETTGRNPFTDKIIQLAMVKVKQDGVVETFNEMFNPCTPRQSQLEAYKIHKISPDTLLSKNKFKEHVENVIEFIGETKYLCGHNVWFDWNFLLEELTRSGFVNFKLEKEYILIDTFKLGIKAFPACPSHSLKSLAEYLNIIVDCHPALVYMVSSPKKKKIEKLELSKVGVSCFHDAMGDTLATKELLFMAVEKVLSLDNPADPPSLKYLHDNQPFATTSTQFLSLLDKYENEALDENELEYLKNCAKECISTLKYSRGSFLKELSVSLLKSEINFLNRVSDINNERQIKIRKLIIGDENSLKRKNSIFENEEEKLVMTDYFSQKKLKFY